MIYFIIFVLLVWVWIITEWINAPINNTNQDNDYSIKSDDTNNQEN
jgi:hypothetical protein